MEHKKIGMLVAVTREIQAVFGRYGEPDETLHYPGFSILTYKNDTYTLYILRSGMGEIAAAAGVQTLITALGVDMIVNFGVVGGLTPEMASARLCVVDRVVHYDYDATAIDGTVVGQYVAGEDLYFYPDRALTERALALCPEAVRVTLASADKFVDSPARKTELHNTFAADVCDMEGAGIVITCARAGVPCLLVKAVADGLFGGGEEFETSICRVAERCFAVVDKIIRNH